VRSAGASRAQRIWLRIRRRLTPARGSAWRVCIAGDEHGRTQRGNNNAYCQDNEISRVDWSLADGDGDLTELVAALPPTAEHARAVDLPRFA
jgi:pullulanase/glycogen debranching enzyme